MSKTLERAIAEAATLPDDVQERIGRELLAHIERLRALRADVDAGLQSLDRGEGLSLDIEDVIRRARKRNGP